MNRFEDALPHVQPIEQQGPILFVRSGAPSYVFGAGQPIGILSMCSCLRSRGWSNLHLLDLRVCTYESQLRRLQEVLLKVKPWVIGISAMSYEAAHVRDMVGYILNLMPSAYIIVGGAFATASGDEVLSIPGVDYVVKGEGEVTILELVKALASGDSPYKVKGISYRDSDGLIHHTPDRSLIEDLDSLPMPAWDMLDMETYYEQARFNRWYKSKKFMTIITSRGCPYECIYCQHVLGSEFRARSPHHVVQEMNELVSKFDIHEFTIVDDNFSHDLLRAKRICDEIIGSGLDIALTFPNGLRADRVDRELLVKLKLAGTYRIAYAFETASESQLKLIGKDLDIKKAERTIKWTDELGMLSHGFFLLGLPGENVQDIEATIEYAANSSLHTANFFYLDVYPNTGLWARLKDKVALPATFDNLYGYHIPTSLASELSYETLARLGRKAHRNFYLKPRRIWRILRLMPKKFLIEGLGVFLMRGFFMWRERPKKDENERSMRPKGSSPGASGAH